MIYSSDEFFDRIPLEFKRIAEDVFFYLRQKKKETVKKMAELGCSYIPYHMMTLPNSM